MASQARPGFNARFQAGKLTAQKPLRHRHNLNRFFARQPWSVDMAFPPWLEPANADWLAQRTADLNGGHDAIVKNDATIVIDIALGNSSRRLPTINMVWLTPTRCADLF